MDPLSITVAVTGLLSAAAAVSKSLRAIVFKAEQGPKDLRAALTEVSELQAAAASLHALIQQRSELPRERTSLISLEQLFATLTEAVMTISSLDAELESLSLYPHASHSDGYARSINKIRLWQRHSTIMSLVQRLQRNKVSLNLIFNIIQW